MRREFRARFEKDRNKINEKENSKLKEFDKEKVVDKAINLFGEKGYNTCSMQDIVDELGLSRSSIYDTFKDKKNLVWGITNYNNKFF